MSIILDDIIRLVYAQRHLSLVSPSVTSCTFQSSMFQLVIDEHGHSQYYSFLPLLIITFPIQSSFSSQIKIQGCLSFLHDTYSTQFGVVIESVKLEVFSLKYRNSIFVARGLVSLDYKSISTNFDCCLRIINITERKSGEDFSFAKYCANCSTNYFLY